MVIIAEIDPVSLAKREKLEVALKTLRIRQLEMDEKHQHTLVGIIDRCLDAFAANHDDSRYTDIVEHRFDTGDARPIIGKIGFHRKNLLESDFPALQGSSRYSRSITRSMPLGIAWGLNWKDRHRR